MVEVGVPHVFQLVNGLCDSTGGLLEDLGLFSVGGIGDYLLFMLFASLLVAVVDVGLIFFDARFYGW